MKLSVILARAKRNSFINLAGEHYIDIHSVFVKEFNQDYAKTGIVGIRKSDNTFTLLASDAVYFSVDGCEMHSISYTDFLSMLKTNAWEKGKGATYSVIEFDENKAVWVKAEPMMCAIWNMSLLFESITGKMIIDDVSTNPTP